MTGKRLRVINLPTFETVEQAVDHCKDKGYDPLPYLYQGPDGRVRGMAMLTREVQVDATL